MEISPIYKNDLDLNIFNSLDSINCFLIRAGLFKSLTDDKLPFFIDGIKHATHPKIINAVASVIYSLIHVSKEKKKLIEHYSHFFKEYSTISPYFTNLYLCSLPNDPPPEVFENVKYFHSIALSAFSEGITDYVYYTRNEIIEMYTIIISKYPTLSKSFLQFFINAIETRPDNLFSECEVQLIDIGIINDYLTPELKKLCITQNYLLQGSVPAIIKCINSETDESILYLRSEPEIHTAFFNNFKFDGNDLSSRVFSILDHLDFSKLSKDALRCIISSDSVPISIINKTKQYLSPKEIIHSCLRFAEAYTTEELNSISMTFPMFLAILQDGHHYLSRSLDVDFWVNLEEPVQILSMPFKKLFNQVFSTTEKIEELFFGHKILEYDKYKAYCMILHPNKRLIYNNRIHEAIEKGGLPIPPCVFRLFSNQDALREAFLRASGDMLIILQNGLINSTNIDILRDISVRILVKPSETFQPRSERHQSLAMTSILNVHRAKKVINGNFTVCGATDAYNYILLFLYFMTTNDEWEQSAVQELSSGPLDKRIIDLLMNQQISDYKFTPPIAKAIINNPDTPMDIKTLIFSNALDSGVTDINNIKDILLAYLEKGHKVPDQLQNSPILIEVAQETGLKYPQIFEHLKIDQLWDVNVQRQLYHENGKCIGHLINLCPNLVFDEIFNESEGKDFLSIRNCLRQSISQYATHNLIVVFNSLYIPFRAECQIPNFHTSIEFGILKKLYYNDPSSHKVFRKITFGEPFPWEPNSPEIDELIAKLTSFPDNQFSADLLANVLKDAVCIFYSTDPIQLMTSFMNYPKVINIIGNLLAVPRFADILTNWFLTTYKDLSISFCGNFLKGLSPWWEFAPVQHVMLGVLHKHKWLDICPYFFKHPCTCTPALSVTSVYIRALMSPIPGLFPSMSIISEMEAPFQLFFGDLLLIPSNKFPKDTVLGAHDKYFNDMLDLESVDTIPCKTPPNIDETFFSQLSSSAKSIILMRHSPPPPNMMKAARLRYLYNNCPPSLLPYILATHPDFDTLLPCQIEEIFEIYERVRVINESEPIDERNAGRSVITEGFISGFLELLCDFNFKQIRAPFESIFIILMDNFGEFMHKTILTMEDIRGFNLLSVISPNDAALYNYALSQWLAENYYIEMPDLSNLNDKIDQSLLERLAVILISGKNRLLVNVAPFLQDHTVMIKALGVLFERHEIDQETAFSYCNVLPEIIDNFHDQLVEIAFNEPLIRSQLLNKLADTPPANLDELSQGKCTVFWQKVWENHLEIERLIQENPVILDFNFSFINQIPFLIPFAIKVARFESLIRSHRDGVFISIIVRRDHIIEDSAQQIMMHNQENLLGRLVVRFVNENGVDGGGVMRDWFTCIFNKLFSSSGYFQRNDAGFYAPKQHVAFVNMEFAGRVFGLAFANHAQASGQLSRLFVKMVLSQSIVDSDFEEDDPQFGRSMKWVLDNDVGTASLNFVDSDGTELIPGGLKIAVTEENKAEYVKKMKDHYISKMETCVQGFRKGLFAVIRPEWMRLLNADDFLKIICGESEIDIEDMKKHIAYGGEYHQNHNVIQRFFRVISKWSMDDRAKLLGFITGSTKLPVGGFASYESPITIIPSESSQRLVTAHTCNNQVELPPYETEEIMDQRLRYAILECNSFELQ